MNGGDTTTLYSSIISKDDTTIKCSSITLEGYTTTLHSSIIVYSYYFIIPNLAEPLQYLLYFLVLFSDEKSTKKIMAYDLLAKIQKHSRTQSKCSQAHVGGSPRLTLS